MKYLYFLRNKNFYQWCVLILQFFGFVMHRNKSRRNRPIFSLSLFCWALFLRLTLVCCLCSSTINQIKAKIGAEATIASLVIDFVTIYMYSLLNIPMIIIAVKSKTLSKVFIKIQKFKINKENWKTVHKALISDPFIVILIIILILFIMILIYLEILAFYNRNSLDELERFFELYSLCSLAICFIVLRTLFITLTTFVSISFENLNVLLKNPINIISNLKIFCLKLKKVFILYIV